ncbi:unnamed protein product [Rangifer tarandus platyrhynchus]|uniref:Uncharacterized protein n=2 Tax=Rangifer tarandus platyrhynchus TaxID=3082113 RepID=A0ACB0EXT6_RANTA|nr:unnamed protein product [Rangifer tarandus platyrhynchus]CAI9705162.1 unnamed protein product [Rangifer tarandus platyrhynchus]
MEPASDPYRQRLRGFRCLTLAGAIGQAAAVSTDALNARVPGGQRPPPPRALALREAGFAPPSLEERRGTVLAPAPCVSGRQATVSAPARGPLCACAVALPPSHGARLSQSVRRSLSSE